MKKALIVGHTGQDGYYLTQLLHKKKYRVIGLSSNSIDSNFSFKNKTKADICNSRSMNRLLGAFKPDEIFYLPAVHTSSEGNNRTAGDLFKKSFDTHVLGLINILEGIRQYSPSSRLFYAASSHVYGNPVETPQDENTPLVPDCIYGTTKAAGIHACRYYRNEAGIFASAGIMYNHESPRRKVEFVSRKIVQSAVAIKFGRKGKLVLGDLNTTVDWGYAPDYMDAAHRILQLNSADDFVISSGEKHSVREFVSLVFKHLGLNWKKHVLINPKIIVKNKNKKLFGINRKLVSKTGWKPTVSFSRMIELLVESEIKAYE